MPVQSESRSKTRTIAAVALPSEECAVAGRHSACRDQREEGDGGHGDNAGEGEHYWKESDEGMK